MGWQFWIDRGGTFTDVLGQDPTGKIHVTKLLSDNPGQYPDAPLQAICSLMGVPNDAPLPVEEIETVKMGTTLATNALLERRGASVGLLVTQGFADLLEIGYQDRPDIFALEIIKPEVLSTVVCEIDERILADGTVRSPLDEDEVKRALERFQSEGVVSVAILFLHSFAYPEHEQRAGALAHNAGFENVSMSHVIAREIKAVGRGDTTMTDAYLTPVLRRYIGTLRNTLGDEVTLRFMQSNGGLTDAERFTGKNAVLSGPAGGVVAYAHTCALAGHTKTIGFDMGGTSTDVSRFDGQFERTYETRIAGVRLMAPMMSIETVAAGGGSILRYDSGRFTVGAESAGAHPGPACYRHGGPATVTDANVVLGRVQPNYFPQCFGASGNEALDPECSRARLQEIVSQTESTSLNVEEVAVGFVRVANENMVNAIKKISVARGYDAREYVLACFGGAGPQHACAIAESLGVHTIILHPFAGVLSAYGMGLADTKHTEVEAVLTSMEEGTMKSLEERFQRLEDRAKRLLAEEGYLQADIDHQRSLDLRYVGVDAYINVIVDAASPSERFEQLHESLYGYVKRGAPIEVVNIRLESTGLTEKVEEKPRTLEAKTLSASDAREHVRVYFEGWRDTPVFKRTDLQPGHQLQGPAMIIEETSTIVVDPGWSVSVNEYDHLILQHVAKPTPSIAHREADPVLIEVFNNQFMSVAEQMGKTLERVSHSANIRERLDFSCAVFSASGDLVANAPHMPVHLGAMGESVRAVLEERGDSMRPGEVYATNDPYAGGSHLPDITVISPVFDEQGNTIFFVANRGHHADVGGITPGSMPPFSKSIDEEGVVLHNVTLVSDGAFHEDDVVALFSTGPHPARNIPERLSDLRAQIASNAVGISLLKDLCGTYGTAVVQAYMDHVRKNAARAMRNRLSALKDGVYSAEDRLDNGARIACTITIEDDHARVDFTGTDDVLPGNLNAPRAISIAAVLYVFRTLIERPIPLNSGCLEPIDVIIPPGSLLDPVPPAAVVGGNVETSMRIVDVLYAALGVMSGSQGTMNNLTFGNDDWGYYETICGGAGAGPGFSGASAVHTHMTNTRITDPEVLERRYPVILREFSVRRGSGGSGSFVGGYGITRAIEFLEAMSVTILSERRKLGPYALAGGERGQPGRNTHRSGIQETDLGGHAQLTVAKGDIIIIQTPGGGGYGSPS